MAQSYRHINPRLARQIKLMMTDVDGTLFSSGDYPGTAVLETIRRSEESGVMVGLVSGRPIHGLESLASNLKISGPIIAENGGVAKIELGGEIVKLDYSRQPSLEALEKLKGLYPGIIKEREDNKIRSIDVVFSAPGLDIEELRRHLTDVQLVDSGYILHLMPKGISKGRTLMEMLPRIGDGTISAAEVMVFGDSLTDLSLFEMFPYSVLIANPRLSFEHRETLAKVARYTSALPFGDGFTEVASHILNERYAKDTLQNRYNES